MNQFAAARFAENVKRLAMGIEPIDAERGTRIAHRISVSFDGEVRGRPGPTVDRHESCLHALIYQPLLADQVTLRLQEGARRFVPRRIAFPIMTAAEAEVLDYRNRVRRPRLYPGAGYDAPSRATGVRGRAVRNGQPLRWTRIEATLPDTDLIIGRAHGDDRGEFFLLLDATATTPGELPDGIEVRVDVFAAAAAPVPETAELPSLDGLWDLPIEQADTLDPADPELDDVSSGVQLPAGYTATAGHVLNIPMGTVLSDPTEYNIP
jgi:hypothetical protein